MPVRPIPKVTDPKVAAQQAALRALALAQEAGSPMKVHFAVNYQSTRSAEAANKSPRKVSFQEHNETIGGVQLSDNDSIPSSTQPNSSETDEELPSPAELAAAKKKCEFKATIQTKLQKSLKERKKLAKESAKVMANIQERKARQAEEDEANRQTWDTCPNNWGSLVDENGERIKRPAWNALKKKIAEGYVPGSEPAATPQVPQSSKMFALPPPIDQTQISKPEKEVLMEERAPKATSGMGFLVSRRTEQQAQPTNRVPSMAPANSNFGRPTPSSTLRATSSTFVPRNATSSAIYNTRNAQPATSMTVVQRRPPTQNTRPAQMIVAAPITPTIRFDATIEEFEQWAAQNYRG